MCLRVQPSVCPLEGKTLRFVVIIVIGLGEHAHSHLVEGCVPQGIHRLLNQILFLMDQGIYSCPDRDVPRCILIPEVDSFGPNHPLPTGGLALRFTSNWAIQRDGTLHLPGKITSELRVIAYLVNTISIIEPPYSSLAAIFHKLCPQQGIRRMRRRFAAKAQFKGFILLYQNLLHLHIPYALLLLVIKPSL